MARLTITLPDDLHEALKVSAARRGRTIGGLVAESLEFYGVKSERSAQDLLVAARRRAAMAEDAALELAVSETAAERGS